MATLAPRSDPAAQGKRLQRIMLALAFYAVCGLIIAFLVWHGFYPAAPLGVYAAGFLAVSGLFATAVRRGWNLRFKDPTMTELQVTCSAFLCSYTLIYAGSFRGMFMLAYVIGLMFASSQVNLRQLTRLAAAPVVLFPGVVYISAILYPEKFDWRIEFVYWISLCVIMLFTSLLIGHLTQLRARLKAANADLELAMDRLTVMAERDELTGLHNRRYMIETLDSEKSRVDRSADGAFCVCLIDMDHFKRINDTFGHAYGDIVLRNFARIAEDCIRGADMLGRWGGEEFLLVLPQTSVELAEACMQRVQAELARTAYEGLPRELRITISAGIAEYRAGGTIKELLDQADQALYRAKRYGRNRIAKAGTEDEFSGCCTD